MQADSNAIFEAALNLTEDERLALVTRLLETVPDEPEGLSLDDPNLVNELKRRSADTEGGIPWNQLRDQL